MSRIEDPGAQRSLQRVQHAARGIRAIALYLFVVGGLFTLTRPSSGVLILGVALLVWYLASRLRTRASRAAAYLPLASSAAVFCYAAVTLAHAPLALTHVTGFLVLCRWVFATAQAAITTSRYHAQA